MSGMSETRSIEIQQLRNLQGPVVDVRSPSEFAKGHWPGAINIPLFNDEERCSWYGLQAARSDSGHSPGP